VPRRVNAPPVTREQVGRLLAYQAQRPGRAVICSELAGHWMAALSVFLPAGDNPVEAWMRDPFTLPPEADLRHAADLGDLLDMLGAPSELGEVLVGERESRAGGVLA
jgi:hypothetical protein